MNKTITTPLRPRMPHREFSAAKSAPSVPNNEGTKIEISTTIQRTPEELFSFWRNFENLPRVMKNIQSVECVDSKHSLWKVPVREGKTVEWDAEIINERPNEMLAWRTLEGSDVQHAGSIWSTPCDDGSGTDIKLAVEYTAGRVADFMAKIFHRSPYPQLREDLRNFKLIMETREPATLGPF